MIIVGENKYIKIYTCNTVNKLESCPVWKEKTEEWWQVEATYNGVNNLDVQNKYKKDG